MNIYDTDFIKSVAASGWYSKQLPRLTRDGKKYVADLLQNCPSKHEQEFNQWVCGAGMRFKPVGKTPIKQKKLNREMGMIHEWYTNWLNANYRGQHESKEKNLDSR